MKFLHTADWHLGKNLDRFSRLEEQEQVLNEITAIADEHEVDMVLIAGDLFDTFMPKVEAVELFYRTLKKLAKNGTRPVIAIAGNHDSPHFIDAPDPLARYNGIILIGSPNAVVQPFKLDSFEVSFSEAGFIELQFSHIPYPVRILHTPYANEHRLKRFLGEEKNEELNQLLKANWENIANKYCDDKGVNLLMTHLYMNKREATLLDGPEGEKPIKVGNADLIYTDAIPTQIQYTALGHLHAYHNIGTENRPIIYSSSPLSYSFSEAGQTKYVSIVEIEPHHLIKQQKIELQGGKSLERKTFNAVANAVEWLKNNQNTLVELTIESDTYLTSRERKSIYQAHDGIVFLIPKFLTIENTVVESNSFMLQHDMEKLFEDYFKSRNKGQTPSEELMQLFNQIRNSSII